MDSPYDRPLAAFDIETIPDPVLGQRLFGLQGDERAVIEGMLRLRNEQTEGKSDFHQPPYHQVVAISVAWLDPNTMKFKLDTLGGDVRDEVGQLRAFFAMLEHAKKAPRLISWNGKGFDVPVLRYRAMMHGIAAPMFYQADGDMRFNNYQNRYHDLHTDLMEVLSGFGSSQKMKLDEICQIMGLPGKTVTEGHRVFGHILDGEIELVREYCELDSLNALLLFLLYEVHRGKLSPTWMRRAVDSIIEAIDKDDRRPAWQAYAKALDHWPSWAKVE